MTRHILYLLPLFLLESTQCKPATLPLSNVQTEAQTTRPLLKAHEQIVRSHKITEEEVFTGYFPQLTGKHTSLLKKEAGIASDAHTISLEGTQLIYSPTGPQAQQALAEKTTAMAQHAYRAATQSVRHDSTHAFLNAWVLQEKAALIQALDRYNESVLASEETRYNTDGNSVHKHNQAHTIYLQNKKQIDSYESEYKAAYDALLSAMGASYRSLTHGTLAYTAVPTPDLAPRETYISLAYAHRPELKEKSEAIAQQKLQSDIHYKSYLPSVSLSGSLGKTFSGIRSERGMRANLSIIASIPLFDGFSRIKKAQAAHAQELRYTFEKQDLKHTIMRQVSTAYSTIEQARYLLREKEQHHDSTTKLLAQAEIAYRTGKLSATAWYKQCYEHELAAHNYREAQSTLRKTIETLAYRCGYPPHIPGIIAASPCLTKGASQS